MLTRCLAVRLFHGLAVRERHWRSRVAHAEEKYDKRVLGDGSGGVDGTNVDAQP